MTTLTKPDRGFIFWPVGSGDATTIIIDEKTVVQVDIRHMNKADDKDEPHYPVVDELIKILPKVNGKPYLSLFVLTHPDKDHCQGFAELLKEVSIGELWFSPRVFTEYKVDLCDDAVAFKNEANRRLRKIIKDNGVAASGDRIRIIGYDEELKEDDYKGFPKELVTVPGTEVRVIDGSSVNGFRAFVHSPFKDTLADGERNETSIGLHVTLWSPNGKEHIKALLFGDLDYYELKKTFEVTTDANVLNWNILLAPHHCSKTIMFTRNSDKGSDEYQEDIVKNFEKYRLNGAYIVSSSEAIPMKNNHGDNPPHAKAKEKYETLIENNRFVCTHEHPNEENTEAIIFEITNDGFKKLDPSGKGRTFPKLKDMLASARGGSSAPTEKVGYGK